MGPGPVLSWGLEPFASFLKGIENMGGCKVTNALFEGWVSFDKPVPAETFEASYKKHILPCMHI
jgi:hypothetical protein